MKLIRDVNNRNDVGYFNNLVRDLLRQFKGEQHSGYTAAHRIYCRYGLNIDWHEFAFMLDDMERQGQAKFIKFGKDSECIYEIL